MYKHCFGYGGSEHASWSECNRRNPDLHDDVSCALRCNDIRYELQLEWAWDRLRRHNGHTDSERCGHLHGDSNELGKWLYEFGIGSCG